MLTLTHTNTHALLSAKSRIQHSQFKISQYALEVLSSAPSEEELGMLFETEQFSPELEEYLFERMDECCSCIADGSPANKSYLELVQEELSTLDLLVATSSKIEVG